MKQTKHTLQILLAVSAGLATALVLYRINTYIKPPSQQDTSANMANEKTAEAKYSIEQVITAYGFSSEEQKMAIQELLRMSDVIPKEQQITEIFPPSDSQEVLLDHIVKLVEELQGKFVQRFLKQEGADKERWEVGTPPWMLANQEQMKKCLTTLGFVTEVQPSRKDTDAICILGASAPAMKKRIEYAAKLIEEKVITPKAVILLAGERAANIKVDGSEEDLCQIAKNFALPNCNTLTETHLLTHAYNNSLLSKRTSEHYVIDTPKNDLHRPTTYSTICALGDWIKDHPDMKHITFISQQPFCKYQEERIASAIKHNGISISYEVVGPELPNKITSAARELGSYIWAAAPRILLELGLMERASSNKKLKTLYPNDELKLYCPEESSTTQDQSKEGIKPDDTSKLGEQWIIVEEGDLTS